MSILKIKAIYGTNRSGKSNFVKAVMAFTKMVKCSVVEENLAQAIWSARFAFTSDNDAPVTFEYCFGDKDQLYRYGFQIYKNNVKSEWLYGNEKDRADTDVEYFLRTGPDVGMNEQIFNGKNSLSHFLQFKSQDIIISDALFLTTCAVFGNTLLSTISQEIK